MDMVQQGWSCIKKRVVAAAFTMLGARERGKTDRRKSPFTMKKEGERTHTRRNVQEEQRVRQRETIEGEGGGTLVPVVIVMNLR